MIIKRIYRQRPRKPHTQHHVDLRTPSGRRLPY
jgi:hypothetical protein